MTDLEILTQLLNYTMPDKDTHSIAATLLDKYGSIGYVLTSGDELLDDETLTLLNIVCSCLKKINWEYLD